MRLRRNASCLEILQNLKGFSETGLCFVSSRVSTLFLKTGPVVMAANSVISSAIKMSFYASRYKAVEWRGLYVKNVTVLK